MHPKATIVLFTMLTKRKLCTPQLMLMNMKKKHRQGKNMVVQIDGCNAKR